MKNITEKRVEFLSNLDKERFYSNIETKGPRGGNNARVICGWSLTPSSGWTRAAHLAGFQSKPWWHGSATTPSRAFPTDLVTLMDDSIFE
jgi:hypothetical protein